MTILKLSELRPDPGQPRQEFNPEDLHLLKKSIASQGILQPLVVEKNGDGKYLLIDGERRYRAATQLGLKEVPAEIIEKKLTEFERLVKRFHLQEQHRSWTYFDKAVAIKKMIETGELKREEVGELLGLSLKSIGDMLALLDMSKRTQNYATKKRLSYNYLTHANRVLNLLKEPNLRPKLEEALVSRLERGTIRKVSEIDEFGFAIRKGGDKIAVKIIKDPDYTHHKAMADSKANDYLHAQRIEAGIHWLSSNLINAMKAKAYTKIKPDVLSDLKRTASVLDQFIKKCNN